MDGRVMDTVQELVISLVRITEDNPLHLRGQQKRILLEHHLRLEHTLLRSSQDSGGANVTTGDEQPHQRPGSNMVDGGTVSRPQISSTRCRLHHEQTQNNVTISSSDGVTNSIHQHHTDGFQGMTKILQAAEIHPQQRQHRPQDVCTRAVGYGSAPIITETSATRREAVVGARAAHHLPQPIPRKPSLLSPSSRESTCLDIIPEGPSPQLVTMNAARSHQPLSPRDTLEDRGEDQARRMARHTLLRRFFRAARAPARRVQAQASSRQQAGAPMFTVGGTPGGRTTSMVDMGVEEGGEGLLFPLGEGSRRREVLRRFLHAMRETVRTRGLTSSAFATATSPREQHRLTNESQNQPPNPPSRQRTTRDALAEALEHQQQQQQQRQRQQQPDARRTTGRDPWIRDQMLARRNQLSEGDQSTRDSLIQKCLLTNNTDHVSGDMTRGSSPVLLGAIKNARSTLQDEGERYSESGISAENTAEMMSAEGSIPVHPREAQRVRDCYHAVFEDMMKLLPPSEQGEGSRGSMQEAVVRCGRECQKHIRALQKGIMVTRKFDSPTGEVRTQRCSLILGKANTSTGEVHLILHTLADGNNTENSPTHAMCHTNSEHPEDPKDLKDLAMDATLESTAFIQHNARVATGSPADEEKRSTRTAIPQESAAATSVRIPVSDLTRVRCFTKANTPSSTTDKPSSDACFQFAILTRERQLIGEARASINDTETSTKLSLKGEMSHGPFLNSGSTARAWASLGSAEGGTKMDVERQIYLREDSDWDTEGSRTAPQDQLKEVAPFGVLSVESEEELCAVVLGVASVRPALEYCRHDVPSCSIAATESSYSTGPESANSDTEIEARKTAAAARLPWQAMRVCIVALAPTLTFVGAVRVVEDALRQACRKHNVSGHECRGTTSCSGIGYLGLLICAEEE